MNAGSSDEPLSSPLSPSDAAMRSIVGPDV